MEQQIAALGLRQFGVVSRQQLLSLGMSSSAIGRLVATGRLIGVHPGVYRLPAAPGSFEQNVQAALLAAGPRAAISFCAAGVIWELEGIRAASPEISIPADRRLHLEGVIVHRTRTLKLRDITRRGSLTVTTPARTLVDLATVLPSDDLEDALDDALRRKIVALRSFHFDGVRRVRHLRRLIQERSPGRISGSGKENQLCRLLTKAGLTEPVRQYEVRDGEGRLVARVDLAYPDIRLAIEFDGYAYHSSRNQWERDIARQNRVINAGWRILRFSTRDVDDRPGEVLSAVRAGCSSTPESHLQTR